MKLAVATLSIIRIDEAGRASSLRDRHGPNVLLRSNSIHPLKIRRPLGCLVARWHVSPETGLIECHWSLCPTQEKARVSGEREHEHSRTGGN
jgi:hypothetical protein